MGFIGGDGTMALDLGQSHWGARESRAKAPADCGVGLDVDPVEEGSAECASLVLGAGVEALVKFLELIQHFCHL